MRLLLQTYDFQLVYKPGRELHIADALSRAPDNRQFVENSPQFSDESVLGCCGVGVVVVVCCGVSSNLSGKISCSNGSRSKTAISPVLGSKWMAETSKELECGNQVVLATQT
jgi:hypothetical protein